MVGHIGLLINDQSSQKVIVSEIATFYMNLQYLCSCNDAALKCSKQWQASNFYISIFPILGKIYVTGQEQGWKIELEGLKEAILQEDAFGTLCYTLFHVSPIYTHLQIC